MSGTKLTNWAYLDSDYEDEVASKNILKKGWYNVDFSNLAATTESEIAAGSSVDIDGVIYLFESLESIFGTETSSVTNYIRVYDSLGVALAEYTTTAPTWDQDKKGYYDATGLKRYILSFYYDGANYLDKRIISEQPVDVFGEVATVTSDYTIPEKTKVKVYLVETTDTVKTTITLPNAVNNKGLILKIIKSTNTFAPVVVDTYSTQTINGWSYSIDSTTYQLLPIFFQNEVCEIASDGSNWKVINNYIPTYDTGIFNNSANVAYQGGEETTVGAITGTFELFEVVLGGTNSEKGIIYNITAASNKIWLLRTVPYDKTTFSTGPFAAGETITGQTSGASTTFSSRTALTKIKYPFISTAERLNIATGAYLYKAPYVVFETGIKNDTNVKCKNVLSAQDASIGGNYGNILCYDVTTDGYLDIYVRGGAAGYLFTNTIDQIAAAGSINSNSRIIIKG